MSPLKTNCNILYALRDLFMKSNWVRRAAVIPPEVVECFDAKLFNMSEKEARYIDPNQRVMLEMCFECLEDAGYAPFNAGTKFFFYPQLLKK
jgi:acyl transferase domain-containing protein